MQAWQKTRMLCIILVVGVLVASAYHLFVGRVLGVGYPGNTFLYNPEIQFSDFYWIFEPIQRGEPYGSKWAAYFPFAYVPLYPLAGLTWQVAYAVVVAVFLATTIHFVWQHLAFVQSWRRIAAAAIITLFSVGVLFAIDRGNIDQLVLVFTLAFFSLFARERYGWSALPLAAAIAMKAYPGAFGVLLLLRRQYKAAALTGLLTVVLTVGAAALYPGGVAETYRMWQLRMASFQEMYVANPVMHQGSLSYLSLVKIFSRVTGLDFTGHARVILGAYSLGAMAIFAIVTAYVMLRERELWKQAYLLAFLVLVLPQVSFDYKLIFLLLPVALFLAAAPGVRREDAFYLGSFGLLLIPKAYFPLGSETKISGFINPLVLTVMAIVIIWTGLRRRVAVTT